MYSRIGLIAKTTLIVLISIFPAISFAKESTPNQSPFDSYPRIAERVFVYDKSQFTAYSGADVSHFELPYTEEPDNPNFIRKRLGIISISPKQRAYLDITSDPMSEYFEIRDEGSGRLIKSFGYYGGFSGALLFSGQGVVYEYRRAGSLCWGKTTNKFALVDGKLVEIPQPFRHLNDADTTLLSDAKLFFKPESASSQVATLNKGTPVAVLSFMEAKEVGSKWRWFLIKTPLGLTGWVPESLKLNDYEPTLAITVCN